MKKDVCEGDNLDLTCPSLSKINIIDANYGRLSSDVCSQGRPASQTQNTNCTSSEALGVIKKACEGKVQCSVLVDHHTLNSGADPCYGIFKYATVNYKCIGKLCLVVC